MRSEPISHPKHSRTSSINSFRWLTPTLHLGLTLMGLSPTSIAAPQPEQLWGTEVDSIRGIETLTDWHTLDTRNLTLRVNHAEHYLLTLQEHCTYLRGAKLVGVSMTNQEIWADFDHVAADGYECRIDRITRLGHSN